MRGKGLSVLTLLMLRQLEKHYTVSAVKRWGTFLSFIHPYHWMMQYKSPFIIHGDRGTLRWTFEVRDFTLATGQIQR
jgi:hypothetical protein